MEAFVTPIILSYVQKYVNLRRQDAQLSLWEGDAVFQNLDLRLDVLQNEFQLPFEFLSGHIHELIIHIPWTKITSEPISITINTIEFVLKLKHLSNTKVPLIERSKSSFSHDESNKGYITTLVDKIVKNISISCNNIILKYIEEDIVVSMNIQLLSLCSANNQWEPFFIDVNPVNAMLRKLMQISDLTICLDKRNSAGQIDICQEPILYKCSLEARVLINNFSDQSISTAMNIEVFTKSLDLNISSQQFPMVMRLVILAMSLKSKDLNKQSEISQTGPENSEISSANSMLSWAWSKVPSIFPEELEAISEKATGGLVNLGIYISNLNVTLKSLEMIPDTLVQNSRKVRYIPVVKVHLNGNYFESCTRGYKWFNAKGGISQLFVEPLANFSKRYAQNMIIFTNENMSNDYLTGSLFDAMPDMANLASLKFDFDEHFNIVNENYLHRRSPAASFDILHYVDIPDGHEFDPQLNQHLEYSNLLETITMRFYINSLTIKHNSAMRGILDVVKEMINRYDYLPYIEEKQDIDPTKLPPPLMDDYDALMHNIPRKTINLKLNNIKLQFHPLSWTDDNKITKIFTNKKLCIENVIPFMVLRIFNISLHNVSPIYVNRLVHTTCQLPSKPKELLDASYSRFNIEAIDTSLVLNWNAIEYNVAKIDNIKLNCGMILKKICWDDDVQQTYGSCMIENFHITFSRPQQLILLKLIKTVMKFIDKELFELVNGKQVYDKSLGNLKLHIHKINGNFLQFRHIIEFGGSIVSLNVYFNPEKGECNETDVGNVLIFEAPKNKLCSESFLKFKLQFLEKRTSPFHPLLIFLVVKESIFICHPMLESILCHEEELATSSFNTDPRRLDIEHKLSRVSVMPERQSRKTNHPDETIHLSSDKGEKCEAITVQSVKAESNEYLSYIRMQDLSECIIILETDQCEIIFPENINFNYKQSLRSAIKNEKLERYIVLRLPAIKFKSVNTLSTNNVTDLPIKHEDDKPIKTNFSWIIELSELSAYLVGEANPIYILMPVKTSVTLAVDRKDTHEDPSLRFNLHLDTVPIACNIYESQVLFLRKSINRLYSVKNIFVCEHNVSNSFKLSKISSMDEDLDIKEFLGIHSSSELSADVVSSTLTQEEQDSSENSSFSLWLQWTLTKVTINFHVERLSSATKLVLDMEDFMTSIDKQNCYFKLKNKIGAISVEYYDLSDHNEWILCDDLKMVAQRQTNENEGQNAFLDLTITIAEVRNVFKKWGTGTKSEASNTLSEIVLNLKALEFHISLKGINDITPLAQLLATEEDKNPLEHNTNCSQINTQSVADLPLVHFNCKGIVLYILEKDATNNCDVFIFQVDSIDIRPNAENPLTRIPLRLDVYTKAEQLRILSTPGSQVEDRQYELVFKNISAATSTWTEILSIKKQNQIGFISNAAVIWNNLEKEPAIKIESIFKGLKISVIYAPCMLYKATIICGQCLELNCITDLNIDITISQLLLISNALETILVPLRVSSSQPSGNSHVSLNKVKLHPTSGQSTGARLIDSDTGMNASKNHITPFTNYSSLIRINRSKKFDNPVLKMQNLSDNINTDSGFVSVEKTSQRKSISEGRAVPYEISVIAGIFIISLHVEKHTDTNESSAIKGLETLLNVKITQPSMLITKKLYEYNVKYSLFDLLVQLGRSDAIGFDVIFETKKGNLNAAGIAPPLLSATYKDSKIGKVHINCNVSRPIKMHACERVIKKLLDIQTMINPIFAVISANQSNETLRPIVRGTPIQILRNSIFDADTLNVCLDRFQFDCINQFQCGLKVNVNKSSLSIENNYYPESLRVKHVTESFLIQSSTRTLLHPITLTCDLLLKQEHWHKSPAIIMKLETNIFHVDISPQQLLNFVTLKDNFMNVWQDYCSKSEIMRRDNTKLSMEIDLKMKESRTFINVPLPVPKRIKSDSRKEEYFQDDLRAGAFQIKEETECNAEAPLPMPYQMKISSNNKTICWRYPQPRFINNFILHPVLIESEVLKSVTCSLEYYNDVLDTFMHFIEFSLSERETQCPKLPEINAPAFIWRIVIQTKPEYGCSSLLKVMSNNTENDAYVGISNGTHSPHHSLLMSKLDKQRFDLLN